MEHQNLPQISRRQVKRRMRRANLLESTLLEFQIPLPIVYIWQSVRKSWIGVRSKIHLQTLHKKGHLYPEVEITRTKSKWVDFFLKEKCKDVSSKVCRTRVWIFKKKENTLLMCCRICSSPVLHR